MPKLASFLGFPQRKKKPKKVKKSRPEPSPRVQELKKEIMGIMIMGFAVLTLLAQILEETGAFGEGVRRTLLVATGERGSFFLSLLLMVLGWQFLRNPRKVMLSHRFFGFALFCLWGIVLMHMTVGLPVTEPLPLGYEDGGGFIGSVCLYGIHRVFSFFGALVVLGLVLLTSLILMLDEPLIDFVKDVYTIFRSAISKFLALFAWEKAPASKRELKPKRRPETPAQTGATPVAPRSVPLEQILPVRPVKEKEAEEIVAIDISGKSGQKLGPYQLPSIELLQMPTRKRGGKNPDQSLQLEETLASFGIQATVVDVYQGPVITRYDLQPAPGVKVSRIVNLANDLALALAARGLRIEAPIPGKAAIGIEVPNKEPRVVTFRELVQTNKFWGTGKLGVAVGVDIAGVPVIADLGKMPHLLIAGATGSGKSVCLSALILSLLYKASPAEVKMIMIDPKMVELSVYDGIPHLSAPVVTEAKKASAVLRAVVAEMETRYKTFAERGVRDLERYNQSLKANENPMPYVVVIIDELADLMMVAPAEVEDAICRLAQMARATGIHLVIATQRPSVDVITGLIKANIPSRIAFAVSSQIDSRTILDMAGAEHLLGRGDMLYAPVGSLKPQRLQGPLVLDEEIKSVTEHWKSQGNPDYVEAFVNAQPQSGEKRDSEVDDDLFWDAVQLVVDYGQASASVLQRRLRVGYARAARLVDMMEMKGLVGPHEGSKPREVLITPQQLAELLGNIKK